MFIRYIGWNYGSFLGKSGRDGQCIEVHDRYGADYVARGMAEVVTAAEYLEYERTIAVIDREVERRVNAPTQAKTKRVFTDDSWWNDPKCTAPAGRLPTLIFFP